MSLKKLIKEKGFSLFELSVTIGLMGIVSLFTMKVMENQAQTQESIEATAEINMTISTIAQTINHIGKCEALFKGRAVNSTLNGLIYSYRQSTNLPMTQYNLLLTRAGQNKVYQNFYIDDANDIRLSGDPTSGMANLTITFRVQPLAKSQKLNLFNLGAGRTIIRQIPFNVITNASNVITSCGPVISASSTLARKTTCDSMLGVGARWDAGARRCYLDSGICPYGQVASGFDATAHVICTPAINQIRADDLFDTGYRDSCLAAGQQTWRLVVVGGKVRLECSP